MGLLNQLGGLGSDIGDALSGGVNALDKALNNQNYRPQDFQKDGFIVPPVPSADGNGLPSSKIPSQQRGRAKRNLVHWFVPEVGVINMYINPQSIGTNAKKLINAERTKGGYIVQYWGEELTTLNIRGNTGSSGVNGLNVLYEIYRAEQYLYDPIALTMAADNSITGLNDIIDSALGNLGGFGSVISAGTTGFLGLDPASQNVLPRNIPSLASMALGVEMYWNGWTYRGFFTNFSFTESADRLGLYEYDIGFTVTQRRGYRTNSMPWHHSAIDGASDWKSNPLSISDLEGTGRGPANAAVAVSGRGPFET